MKFRDVVQKAKSAARKAIAPTNEDRYEQARKIQAKNKIKEEKIRSMEALHRARQQSLRLQERERKSRVNPLTERPSSQKVARAYSWGNKDPFEAFNSPLFGFGGSSTAGKTAGKRKKKEKKEKPPEFPDFNFL